MRYESALPLFGVLNTSAKYYINVCPEIGFIVTDIGKLQEKANDKVGFSLKEESDGTGAGFCININWLEWMNIARTVDIVVEHINNRAAAGKYAEEVVEKYYKKKGDNVTMAKTLAEQYKDIDMYINKIPIQVKYDGMACKTKRIFLETHKKSVTHWMHKDTSYDK